ncbi:MAG: hypothetical protein MN733_19765 [Nitrososphaera sp.]|nr:hypothetical protein [Nitrososphaera sp.]
MKIVYKFGNLQIQAEGETQKEIFRQLAELMEIFGERCCGLCMSQDIRFEVRVDKDGHSYYSMRCVCGAQLQYGQNKKGETLFAKRDAHPKSLGWHIYRRD